MQMNGAAPSGDFWFLLVASKGTRRRQGIWGTVVNLDCGTDEFREQVQVGAVPEPPLQRPENPVIEMNS